MKTSVISRFKKQRAQRPRFRQTLSTLLQAAALEAYQVEVTYQPIKLAKLPAEFNRFRLVQLSDIHHSSFLSEANVAEAVRCANALQPDLIALTGDYVSYSTSYIAGCARALAHLRARCGVFAVLGNHDHWTDGELMARALEEAGIRVLCNESLHIRRGKAHLCLAGIDDLMVKRDDLGAALAGTRRDEVRILLAHNPAIIREAAREGVDLVLAGHTHGGQINWRLLLGRSRLLVGRHNKTLLRWLQRPSRRFLRGHSYLGATQLYVNRGLGTVLVPLRYGCPPEITLIELRN